MKKEFKMVAGWVMSVLGIQNFSKDNDGKLFLTAEQEQKLSEKYGQQFVDGFKADLAKYQDTEVVPLSAAERLELDASRQETARLKAQIETMQAAEKDFKATIAKLEKQAADGQGKQVEVSAIEQAAIKAGVDLSMKHNRYLVDYMQGKVSAAYSGDSTIDTSELKKEFGKYVAGNHLEILKGLFGQTESTLILGNFVGMKPKVGSMGKPNPLYRVELLNHEGRSVNTGESGEVCIYVGEGAPCGLFTGYYNDPEATAAVWHDGYYHTGDLAWRDEDGYYWYIGRADDLIKSSGYRIGPFEIESVLMELPYVLECGVSPAPDPVRGQVVKASIVLVNGTEPSEALKKEIQEYVKKRTAPYKYPRIVEFMDSLPKTSSGKIIRSQL